MLTDCIQADTPYSASMNHWNHHFPAQIAPLELGDKQRGALS